MIGKNQGQVKPTALGTLLQAATYGATIPTVYGTTQSSLLAIWAANLRQGASTKKNKKKGITTYVENIDFLVGSNPIGGILQVWNNGTKFRLNFSEYTMTFSGSSRSVTIPDPHFYYLLAVTAEIENKGTFDDYGGNGPTAYDDTSEFPLWNVWQGGPATNDPTYQRCAPYIFQWNTLNGPVVNFPHFDNYYSNPPYGYGIPNWNGVLHFYYAAIDPTAKGDGVPLDLNRLTFESELGNGSEYSGFTSQQIVYPEYAGVGSPDMDCGAGPAIPDLQPEVSGSFARFAPRGDADFADMIEDVIKSGMLQVGTQLGLIQRGVNLNEMPAAVDKIQADTPLSNGETEGYWAQGLQQPIAAGQIIFAFARWALGTAPPNLTIADTPGANTWIPIFLTGAFGLWYAINAAPVAAGNLIAIHTNAAPGPATWLRCYAWVMDPGSDAINGIANTSGSGTNSGDYIACSITVTDASVQTPAYLLAAVNSSSGWYLGGLTSPIPPPIPFGWTNLFPFTVQNQILQDQINDASCVAYRIVTAPGTYEFKIRVNIASTWAIGMAAVVASQPVPYPAALGDILDKPSLNLVRQQCQANGLWGSVTMNSQKTAADWLKDFYICANAAPVWSGFVLKSIPYSEVSAVGNGIVYTAPTAKGPVFTLQQQNMVGDPSKPIVNVERKAQVDSTNVLQMQYYDRNADYNPSVASEPLSGAITLYGPRKQDPMLLPEIQDAAIARKILAVQVRRLVLLRNVYTFTVTANFATLEAMDLIAINEPKLGITNLPVRITKILEQEDYSLDVTAEPFFYGCNAPNTLPVTTAVPFSPSTGATPPSVNQPIIFEPVPRLSAQQNQGQVWCVVSGGANYGGALVYLSTDGGASYNPIGQITGNAVTGYTTADWPAHVDPDTTNDLPVDLTESLGALESYAVADEDNFVYPCLVTPGLTCIPYELMTYAVATLTAANKYTLKATGGNHLRRAVYSAPQAGTGVDHPYLSRFAFLNPSGTGIFKINLDPLWIGKTLYFKFCSLNGFGSQPQDPSTVTAYSYTPTGCPSVQQNPNTNAYTITGGALTNPTSTTIHMAQATAQFPSGTAVYNARTFTISAPSVPTTYYVTIADPAQLGDEGGSTNLTATAQTSDALVGAAGNVYIGSIVVLPAGGGTVVGPGGSTPGGANADEILVNGT